MVFHTKGDDMKIDPFVLSEPCVIDPAYSVKECRPDKTGLSLWSEKSGGPLWLYTPGNLEAWLLDRTRREAFTTCVNIYHPGRYRTVQPTLYARRRFTLASVPASVPCTLYFNGSLYLKTDSRVVLLTNTSGEPQKFTLDLAPYLVPGENTIQIRVVANGGPPTFLLAAPSLQSDQDWKVSVDDLKWHAPRCFPFEGDRRFPHQETLPELPVVLDVDEDGLYDAGLQLLARVAVSAQGEGPIAVYVGESKVEALNPCDDVREQVVPVLPVAGEGEFRSETKLAFRYLRLGHTPGVQITSAQALASVYPTRYQGAFACSDQRLTSIWMHAAYTLRACMQLVFVDGLKRDRLPWVGDLFVCNLGNYQSFFETPISEYSLSALMGEDPEEADINGTITYSLFWIMAARDHALHCGDSAFLQSLLPYCGKLMAAIRKKTDNRCLLPSDRFSWIYVDWADVHTGGVCSFLNFLHVMALDAAADLHRAVGHETAASEFARQADELRTTCRAFFWDSGRKLFLDNVEPEKTDVHFGRQCNALAVLSGVCTLEQRPDVLRNVLLNKAVAPVGTPYMMFFEARALAACGEHEAMLAMIRDYWGSMLDAGASTFWEAHEVAIPEPERYAFYGRPFAKSLCHAWSSGPLPLLSAELFGLRPLKCGWAEFTLKPAVSGLEWACAEVPTPQGPIRVQIAGQRLSVTFPQGTLLVLGDGKTDQRHPGPAELEFTTGFSTR